MKLSLEAGALAAAAGTLAIAVPATAHPGPGDHPADADPGSQSHKCRPHDVGYVESGIVDAGTPSTLAQKSDGSWSGTLVVDVTRSNHWAKVDKGTTVTETFTDAKLRVRFDGTTSGFTAGERVHLIGNVPLVAKNAPRRALRPRRCSG